jgi:hypothetical protein
MHFVNPFDTKAERNEGAVPVRRKPPTSYDNVPVRVGNPISQKVLFLPKSSHFSGNGHSRLALPSAPRRGAGSLR